MVLSLGMLAKVTGKGGLTTHAEYPCTFPPQNCNPFQIEAASISLPNGSVTRYVIKGWEKGELITDTE